MRIIGFNITKIHAERDSEIKGKLEIKSNINIEDIKEEKIEISEKSAIRFVFSFLVEYSPKFGKIEIKGSIVAVDDSKDSKDSKEILKEWKKKKFFHSVKLSLFNFILSRCNIKSLQLEEEIGLPSHIPMPKFTQSTEQNSQNKNPTNYAG